MLRSRPTCGCESRKPTNTPRFLGAADLNLSPKQAAALSPAPAGPFFGFTLTIHRDTKVNNQWPRFELGQSKHRSAVSRDEEWNRGKYLLFLEPLSARAATISISSQSTPIAGLESSHMSARRELANLGIWTVALQRRPKANELEDGEFIFRNDSLCRRHEGRFST